jgi:hypothetical protein
VLESKQQQQQQPLKPPIVAVKSTINRNHRYCQIPNYLLIGKVRLGLITKKGTGRKQARVNKAWVGKTATTETTRNNSKQGDKRKDINCKLILAIYFIRRFPNMRKEKL